MMKLVKNLFRPRRKRFFNLKLSTIKETDKGIEFRIRDSFCMSAYSFMAHEIVRSKIIMNLSPIDAWVISWSLCSYLSNKKERSTVEINGDHITLKNKEHHVTGTLQELLSQKELLHSLDGQAIQTLLSHAYNQGTAHGIALRDKFESVAKQAPQQDESEGEKSNVIYKDRWQQ